MAGKPNVSAVALAGCHCLAMRQAARQVTRFYDSVLVPSGLRTTQFSVLATLHASAPMTINKLAEELVLDRTTLGRNIQPLQREGLVAVIRSKDDHRRKLVHVTEAGVTRLKMSARLWTKAQTRFEAALGAPHVSGLRALLRELTGAELQG